MSLDDELHRRVGRLRETAAIELAAIHARQEAESRAFNDAYGERLFAMGLTEDEVRHEMTVMIVAATPGADTHRMEMRELLRRYRAGSDLLPEELEQVKRITALGTEDMYLDWRSEAEKEADSAAESSFGDSAARAERVSWKVR